MSDTRSLGRNGPLVSAIGLGTMSLGGAYGQQDSEEEKLAFLDHAYAIGQRFWDTADIYFDSEPVIGKWFKRSGKRDEIFLATKFGLDYTDWKQTIQSDPEYVRMACEKSLVRLEADTVDLYYCHRVDGVTPIEKTIEAMMELKKCGGKIRYLGLSEVSAATIRRAYAVHPISAVQMEYSPFCLDIEPPQSDVLQTCRELGITVVAYSPMGRGLLTGQFQPKKTFGDKDFRLMIPRYEAGFDRILQVVETMKIIGEAHGCTPSQVALAWLLAQGPDIIPIPGTRTIKYLEQNAAAVNVKLTDEEIKEIRKRIEESEFAGDRYPHGMEFSTDTPSL
ncbi:hypothetical protein ASPZODRAFT_19192 [Penicilliopsis zonata CBS 506.65]|uniref:NADP-dependent oxidoreductase domain-containing protein n=1 Tax=Penicilliopsis zonata CBS 506.65 TaxID=1073090 RepID=A0A1L9S9M8_9EURO|nr:hypothetical protein ASPZODRAFT_19192 [Penicilliopsis zonata CBS 506.65]OJJ43892.1 hypothetical protein ASPZODRAFT_19192 [Penicilliopsis zonata CBS 506.65]